ncbi:MAG: preprotein translocase subunit YajC [Lachnospiraceae bacterium]|nr:preprotein translocase subunit YajC [Lachnospiraceae bacterium]
MNFITNLGFFAAQTQGASLGQMLPMIIFWVVLLGVMYVMMIRPQKKQQKEHDIMVNNIEVGDSVVTSSGFYGVVISVIDESVVVVEFGNNKNCRIPMKRDHISEVEKSEK